MKVQQFNNLVSLSNEVVAKNIKDFVPIKPKQLFSFPKTDLFVKEKAVEVANFVKPRVTMADNTFQLDYNSIDIGFNRVITDLCRTKVKASVDDFQSETGAIKTKLLIESKKLAQNISSKTPLPQLASLMACKNQNTPQLRLSAVKLFNEILQNPKIKNYIDSEAVHNLCLGAGNVFDIHNLKAVNSLIKHDAIQNVDDLDYFMNVVRDNNGKVDMKLVSTTDKVLEHSLVKGGSSKSFGNRNARVIVQAVKNKQGKFDVNLYNPIMNLLNNPKMANSDEVVDAINVCLGKNGSVSRTLLKSYNNLLKYDNVRTIDAEDIVSEAIDDDFQYDKKILNLADELLQNPKFKNVASVLGVLRASKNIAGKFMPNRFDAIDSLIKSPNLKKSEELILLFDSCEGKDGAVSLHLLKAADEFLKNKNIESVYQVASILNTLKTFDGPQVSRAVKVITELLDNPNMYEFSDVSGFIARNKDKGVLNLNRLKLATDMLDYKYENTTLPAIYLSAGRKCDYNDLLTETPQRMDVLQFVDDTVKGFKTGNLKLRNGTFKSSLELSKN